MQAHTLILNLKYPFLTLSQDRAEKDGRRAMRYESWVQPNTVTGLCLQNQGRRCQPGWESFN